MIHIISTSNGDIHFEVDAANIDEACEAMAVSFDYPSYAAMCADLGYSRRDFTVSRIVIKEPREAVSDDRGVLLKKMARTTLNAFKFVRRNQVKRQR